MEKDKLFAEMKQAVLDGEIELAEELANKAIEEGLNPLEAIETGYVAGIDEVGALFEQGQIFLPELIAAAEAMKAALNVLEPALQQRDMVRAILGKVVIGTMHNDIHDIGKDMVASMLMASGFEVTNLGVNVPCDTFISNVKEQQADILALSALLTTTMPEQKIVIEALEKEGLRSGVKVLVGGAPVNRQWADEIKADGYAENAIEAVKVARQLVGK
jgi:corrinoid protein of di/trimethylamine methyltransferase